MKHADATSAGDGDLRRAVAWLIEQPRRDARAIEEASRRFNLSPLGEAFLLEHFHRSDRGGSATSGD
jgi:hypothetical protein